MHVQLGYLHPKLDVSFAHSEYPKLPVLLADFPGPVVPAGKHVTSSDL